MILYYLVQVILIDWWKMNPNFTGVWLTRNREYVKVTGWKGVDRYEQVWEYDDKGNTTNGLVEMDLIERILPENKRYQEAKEILGL